jgi:hypothetical protein
MVLEICWILRMKGQLAQHAVPLASVLGKERMFHESQFNYNCLPRQTPRFLMLCAASLICNGQSQS